MKREDGFSLIELFTVIALMGIIAAFAIPTFITARADLLYRQEARSIGSKLREARARTVSLNREHQVQLDLTAGANQYQMQQGNASSGSGVWTAVAGQTGTVATGLVLTQAGCLGAAPLFTVGFNTNGSADAGCVISVRDAATNTVRHTVTVVLNTGRVRIQ